jgi:P27 family predicted phage terminase small subunit
MRINNMSHAVPTKLKLIRGNPGHQKIHTEPEPHIPDEVPEPPAMLSEPAREEWKRMAAELHRLGLLTTVDLNAFGAYCQSYGRWYQAERALAKMAEQLPNDALMVRGSQGKNLVQNPLVKIADRAALNMIRIASEFGCTPAARARIAAGWQGPQRPSKFEGLLAG